MAGSDKTVFDPGATVAESDKTVLESDATALDDGATLPKTALSDAAGQTDADARENIAIQKGDTILDTYHVESDAIEGGMGSVWWVHHTGWNVDLAMKRPQPKYFSTEKSKADFIHECEAWINLGLHPNVVSCYYVRKISGTPSIFSEWMDGCSLESAIQNGTIYAGTEVVQKERLLNIAIQFARGLHYAHEAGLIHQDAKPDNVLLTKEGEAKVADFGLARARAILTAMEGNVTMRDAADGGKTMLSPSGGYTPAYCSMEQMDGKPLTRRTDIYSWAVSAMEMYLGARPWANGVVAGLSCAAYFKKARVPMPEALKDLLSQCLKDDPEDRPHDFAEIETRLQEIYRAETGIAYPRPAPKAAADTADSLNNRALSMLDLGKTDEAEKLWERALSANPQHIMSIYNQSLHLWRKGTLSDVGALKEIQHVIDGNADDTANYAQALLHMERGAGNDALKLLKLCQQSDKNIAEAIGRAQEIGHPKLEYVLEGTLRRHHGTIERGGLVPCIAFSECGNYVKYGECIFVWGSGVIEEVSERGYMSYWRLTDAKGVALDELDPEIRKIRWQQYSIYGSSLQFDGLSYGTTLCSGRSGGEWYVQNSESRFLYTNYREVTDRPYNCLDKNSAHMRIACGQYDGNNVDVFSMPKLHFIAPWLLCKVRSQREQSTQDDRFQELSNEIHRKLSLMEPEQALSSLRDLLPLVNAANQLKYRHMNAETGKFCRPISLRAIYREPLNAPPPKARFGFHASYESVFADRWQNKLLWEDIRHKASSVGKAPAAVSSDQTLLVYAVYERNHWFLVAADPLSGVEKNSIKLSETPGDICFFPDGKSFLVALCETVSVIRINVRTFQIDKRYSGRKTHLTEQAFLRINPAGTFFVYGMFGESHAHKGDNHEALTFVSIQDDHTVRYKDGFVGFNDYISDALFSEYDGWFLTKHFDKTVRIWETATGRCIQRFSAPETLSEIVDEGRLDWEYEFPGFADWDEGARPYLEKFLALHPFVTEAAFVGLLNELQTHGYGWLRREGVDAKLDEMTDAFRKRGRGLFGRK